MRPLWKDVLTALFMGLVVPGLLLNAGVLLLDSQAAPVAQETEETAETLPPKISLPVRIRAADGSVTETDMYAYLVGVILAEMPADFAVEALKAQSVAARTYARKAYETGGKHGDGSVCPDPGCCQAYLTQSDYLARGGGCAGEWSGRIDSALPPDTLTVAMARGEHDNDRIISVTGGTAL